MNRKKVFLLKALPRQSLTYYGWSSGCGGGCGCGCAGSGRDGLLSLRCAAGVCSFPKGVPIFLPECIPYPATVHLSSCMFPCLPASSLCRPGPSCSYSRTRTLIVKPFIYSRVQPIALVGFWFWGCDGRRLSWTQLCSGRRCLEGPQSVFGAGEGLLGDARRLMSPPMLPAGPANEDGAHNSMCMYRPLAKELLHFSN